MHLYIFWGFVLSLFSAGCGVPSQTSSNTGSGSTSSPIHDEQPVPGKIDAASASMGSQGGVHLSGYVCGGPQTANMLACGIHPYGLNMMWSRFPHVVDTESYRRSRYLISSGRMPKPESVRIEEFVNYFTSPRPEPPPEHMFSTHIEAAPSPWAPNQTVLHLGVSTPALDSARRKPMALTFMVDISAESTRPETLPYLVRSLNTMRSHLGPGDTVAIATGSGENHIVLPPTSARDQRAIANAIEALSSRVRPTSEDWIDIAYGLADAAFKEGVDNRVILISGTEPQWLAATNTKMLARIKQHAERGVSLSIIGYQRLNPQYRALTLLANNGDGQSFFADNMAEAEEVGARLLNPWHIVAHEVQFGVEFNPKVVKAYRLIGNDTLDRQEDPSAQAGVHASSIWAGHSVTALYELTLHGAAEGQIGMMRLHYKKPGQKGPAIVQRVPVLRDIRHEELQASSKEFRIALGAASFAEMLRGSKQIGEFSYSDIATMIRSAVRPQRDEDRELLELVSRAATLPKIRPTVPSKPHLSVDWCPPDPKTCSPMDSDRAFIGSPVVHGGRSPLDIQAVVARKSGAIQYCYQREAAKNKDLAGTLIIEFVIGEDGVVRSAEAQKSTLGSSTIDACISGLFQRMTFEEARGQGRSLVIVPLEFSAP